MKVQVLSIEPTKESSLHEVLLSIGENQQVFMFATEVNQIGEQEMQTTHGDETFAEVFRFNQRVAMNITNLVVKFYNKETVELPADVGNFVTPEAAVAKLKTFSASLPIM